ncbi:uncharacterized protein DSM5745_02924 [Aspergillus mulundensis]|uniref:Uncharacterized protein n=1 Tax=Aspergillus mulundensis TaxID=1810919 RepID=A0A3D8SJ37_9EURO|nr:hypothetical protein DSM5745_02924 [Aspergillus mulundensis]RDW86282.1 hypothetical protein DSM5745_02924 [Aspergillus mulundensis]
MRALWKAPWMRLKLSISDEQRDHLLSQDRDADQISQETPTQTVNPQERYVGFGIGGAGNIRKVRPHGVVKTAAAEAKDR